MSLANIEAGWHGNSRINRPRSCPFFFWTESAFSSASLAALLSTSPANRRVRLVEVFRQPPLSLSLSLVCVLKYEPLSYKETLTPSTPAESISERVVWAMSVFALEKHQVAQISRWGSRAGEGRGLHWMGCFEMRKLHHQRPQLQPGLHAGFPASSMGIHRDGESVIFGIEESDKTSI
jgi:hypothetical protein